MMWRIPMQATVQLRGASRSRRHHRCARSLHGGKLGIEEISERVGHSSAVMTLDRYAHAPTDAHDCQRDALDALVSTPSNVTPISRKAR